MWKLQHFYGVPASREKWIWRHSMTHDILFKNNNDVTSWMYHIRGSRSNGGTSLCNLSLTNVDILIYFLLWAITAKSVHLLACFYHLFRQPSGRSFGSTYKGARFKFCPMIVGFFIYNISNFPPSSSLTMMGKQHQEKSIRMCSMIRNKCMFYASWEW